MNFEKLNNKSISDAFAEFDSANPAIWKLFVQYATQWIEMQIEKSGIKDRKEAIKRVKISSKQIIGRIRWWNSVETISETPYRINDAFTAFYSRKFIDTYPEYATVFELRELRTGNQLSIKFSKAI